MNLWNPDFIIQTGDYAQTPTAEEYVNLEAVYTTSMAPYYYVIGNHDEASLFLGNTTASQLYYSFDVNGFHFVVLDDSHNYIENSQVSWLEEDLGRSQKTTIIFVHRPITPFYNTWKYAGITITNSDEILSLLEADGDVVATFSGHNHVSDKLSDGWIEEVNGTTHFNLREYLKVTLNRLGDSVYITVEGKIPKYSYTDFLTSSNVQSFLVKVAA